MYLPFYQAMYPYLARKSFNEKLKMMKKLIPVITIIGIIGFSIIFLMGDWIIQLLYKDNAIYENIYLFKWMGLIAFFTGLSLLFHSLYAPARKLFNDRMKMTITAGIFNIILSLIIVPIYGLKGTVISVICTEFLLLGMATLFYYKDLKKSL